MFKYLLALFALTSQAQAFDATGLKISVAGDLVYDQGLNSQSEADENFKVRGAELSLYAPVDHLFEARLSAAAHDEEGETVFEVHELYLQTSKLIPRSRLKVGQFFLGIGRLNRFHQHDWPFTLAPLIHESILGDEGVFDTGAEFSTLLPLPFYFDLTVGITSGHKFGHAHSEGEKPKTPTHYTRASSFVDFGSQRGLEYGLSYLGRTSGDGDELSLLGFDLTFKKRVLKKIDWLVQTETWYRKNKTESETESRLIGSYLFVDKNLSHFSSLGLRVDMTKDLTKKNSLTGKKVNNISYGITPQLTYKSSEFFTFRLSASHEFEREEGDTLSKDTKILSQFVFILGAHPAHEF